MAGVKERPRVIDIAELTEGEAVELLVKYAGFTPEYARFYYAVVTGEVDGDVTVPDDPRNTEPIQPAGF